MLREVCKATGDVALTVVRAAKPDASVPLALSLCVVAIRSLLNVNWEPEHRADAARGVSSLLLARFTTLATDALAGTLPRFASPHRWLAWIRPELVRSICIRSAMLGNSAGVLLLSRTGFSSFGHAALCCPEEVLFAGSLAQSILLRFKREQLTCSPSEADRRCALAYPRISVRSGAGAPGLHVHLRNDEIKRALSVELARWGLFRTALCVGAGLGDTATSPFSVNSLLRAFASSKVIVNAKTAEAAWLAVSDCAALAGRDPPDRLEVQKLVFSVAVRRGTAEHIAPWARFPFPSCHPAGIYEAVFVTNTMQRADSAAVFRCVRLFAEADWARAVAERVHVHLHTVQHRRWDLARWTEVTFDWAKLWCAEEAANVTRELALLLKEHPPTDAVARAPSAFVVGGVFWMLVQKQLGEAAVATATALGPAVQREVRVRAQLFWRDFAEGFAAAGMHEAFFSEKMQRSGFLDELRESPELLAKTAGNGARTARVRLFALDPRFWKSMQDWLVAAKRFLRSASSKERGMAAALLFTKQMGARRTLAAVVKHVAHTSRKGTGRWNPDDAHAPPQDDSSGSVFGDDGLEGTVGEEWIAPESGVLGALAGSEASEHKWALFLMLSARIDSRWHASRASRTACVICLNALKTAAEPPKEGLPEVDPMKLCAAARDLVSESVVGSDAVGEALRRAARRGAQYAHAVQLEKRLERIDEGNVAEAIAEFMRGDAGVRFAFGGPP